MQRTKEKYNLSIEINFPDSEDIKELIEKDGPNLFYKSIENRKKCCFVRKVKPLQKILKTLDIWITGIRSEQNPTRTKTEIIEWDEQFGIYKLNPLYNWSNEKVWKYIKTNSVPYNHLHDRNFPSIGCAPCTRAIQPGEDIRSGRWWWEDSSKKECGLHLKK
jgi:phosphoadenosine phosphosulfate reductase